MSSRTNDIGTHRYSDVTAAPSKPGLTSLSFVMIGVGSVILLWTVLDLLFREATAGFSARFCLPLATGIAVIVWGALVETKWRRFGAWLGLALVGQAASLQMIDAGRLIHFQHYRSVPELVRTEPLALTFLMLQMACVGVGFSSRLTVVKQWIGARFAGWQVGLIMIFLALSSAAVTPNFATYGTSLATGAVLQLVNIANVILLASSVPSTVASGWYPNGTSG